MNKTTAEQTDTELALTLCHQRLVTQIKSLLNKRLPKEPKASTNFTGLTHFGKETHHDR